MAANIDAMRRINDREVVAQGWLADPGGDATPLKLRFREELNASLVSRADAAWARFGR